MPTGYTSDIEKGVSFEQFVWSCARGMGALILMRDSPHDAPIPERLEPLDYHQKEAEETQKEVNRVANYTPSEAKAACLKEWKAANTQQQNYESYKDVLREKYEAMLLKAKAWEPPSPDHQGLKDFMIEQIEGSLKFDCRPSAPRETEPLPNVAQWRKEKLRTLRARVKYQIAEHNKEVERTEGRNVWLAKLRGSVPQQ